MTDRDQSIRTRVRVSPNGRARKVPIAECPRCHQDVDLKGHKLEDGDSELVFKSHHDHITDGPCPTAGMTPAAAAAWIAETRQLLGLELVS